VGADAFRTATGVHASAVLKAERKKDRDLMDAVYAAVPARLVGRTQEIEIGPLSGRANVVYWLDRRGLPMTDAVIDRILAAAKASPRVLTEVEIRALL
jgi:2-isopropylmalate synthase